MSGAAAPPAGRQLHIVSLLVLAVQSNGAVLELGSSARATQTWWSRWRISRQQQQRVVQTARAGAVCARRHSVRENTVRGGAADLARLLFRCRVALRSGRCAMCGVDICDESQSRVWLCLWVPSHAPASINKIVFAKIGAPSAPVEPDHDSTSNMRPVISTITSRHASRGRVGYCACARAGVRACAYTAQLTRTTVRRLCRSSDLTWGPDLTRLVRRSWSRVQQKHRSCAQAAWPSRGALPCPPGELLPALKIHHRLSRLAEAGRRC